MDVKCGRRMMRRWWWKLLMGEVGFGYDRGLRAGEGEVGRWFPAGASWSWWSAASHSISRLPTNPPYPKNNRH